MKMKKTRKRSSIFEFSISKLGYMEIFMKIWEKNETKKLFHYFTIQLWLFDGDGKKVDIKNKNEDENISKNEVEFWILHVKIRLRDNFHENLRRKQFDPFFKTFLTNRGKNEDVNENFLENEFDLWILHIKISYADIFKKIWE